MYFEFRLFQVPSMSSWISQNWEQEMRGKKTTKRRKERWLQHRKYYAHCDLDCIRKKFQDKIIFGRKILDFVQVEVDFTNAIKIHRAFQCYNYLEHGTFQCYNFL